MGTLRFLLAFAVLNVHTGSIRRFPIGGDTAVQMFFIISGYYMAMVLNEKYAPGQATNFDFWRSRAFRIFPAYYAVLGAVLLVGILYAGISRQYLPPFEAWRTLLAGGANRGMAFLGIAQGTLVGLDLSNFTAFNSGMQLIFTADFWRQEFPAWRTLLVPQAWTLSTEWYFYLLAPFVVRRRLTVLVSVLVASFLLRVLAAVFLDWRTDPWSYRFFPFELLFFMAGALAYRFGKMRRVKGSGLMSLMIMMAILVAAAGAMGRLGVPGQSRVIAPLLLGLLFLGIDRLFDATRHNRLDRLAGDFSYPLYLCHVLVIWIVGIGLPTSGISSRVVAPLAAVAVAVAIYWGIEKRVDVLRYRLIGALQSAV